MKKLLVLALAAALALSLVACGGGGDTGDTNTPSGGNGDITSIGICSAPMDGHSQHRRSGPAGYWGSSPRRHDIQAAPYRRCWPLRPFSEPHGRFLHPPAAHGCRGRSPTRIPAHSRAFSPRRSRTACVPGPCDPSRPRRSGLFLRRLWSTGNWHRIRTLPPPSSRDTVRGKGLPAHSRSGQSADSSSPSDAGRISHAPPAQSPGPAQSGGHYRHTSGSRMPPMNDELSFLLLGRNGRKNLPGYVLAVNGVHDVFQRHYVAVLGPLGGQRVKIVVDGDKPHVQERENPFQIVAGFPVVAAKPG